ncbi:hypothetical protein CcCBS67573_g06474 [Chytriomyces confervae]|nr:hypothetical protein CcCBS67573_g06474 [Chytriomyces confervae]
MTFSNESDSNVLLVCIESRDAKLLRTAVTSIMESVQLVSDAIDAFK